MGLLASPHRGRPALCQAGHLLLAPRPHIPMWAGAKAGPPVPEIQPPQERIWRVWCWGSLLAEVPSPREAEGDTGAGPHAAGAA